MLKLSAGNAIFFSQGEKVEMQNVLECEDIDTLFKIKYIPPSFVIGVRP